MQTAGLALATRARRRRGVAVIYGVCALTAVMAISSLAVDYGRAQLARSEVQACADSAARAAASGIPTSLATARTRGKNAAAMNEADGSSITLIDGDFTFGKWNATTNALDAASGSAIDAVHVTVSRTVPLLFGATFGKESASVVASAIAKRPSGAGIIGFIGLNGVAFKNNTFIGSYKSSVTTNPTRGSSTGKGNLSSNATMEFKNNSTINGDVILGPSGNVSGSVSISGTTTFRGTPTAAPADPAWSPSANPGGVPQNYTVNSNTTLPGGTYWFTDLHLNKKLTFSGPATVYVNGNIHTDDSIVTYQSLPSNLQIYQLGANRTFDVQKDLTLSANVHAPGSALIGNNNLYLRGSGIYKTIEAKNNADFYFDEDASSGGSGGGINLVQ